MVIVDVQRGGPSTGMPTKPEQADLLQAMFGRNGESPIPVLAPLSQPTWSDITIEAFRLAVRAMTPVFVLLGNGHGRTAPSLGPCPIPTGCRRLLSTTRRSMSSRTAATFCPMAGTRKTMALGRGRCRASSAWSIALAAAREPGTGNVSYAPEDNDRMIRDRAQKVAKLADFIPLLEALCGKPTGDVLVVGWGNSHGAIHQAVERAQRGGQSVSAVHLRHLNPFPRNLGEILDRSTRSRCRR